MHQSLEYRVARFLHVLGANAQADKNLYNAVRYPGHPTLRNGVLVCSQCVELDFDNEDDDLSMMIDEEVSEVFRAEEYLSAGEADDGSIEVPEEFYILHLHDAQGFYKFNVRYNIVVRFGEGGGSIIDYVNVTVMESSDEIDEYEDVISNWLHDITTALDAPTAVGVKTKPKLTLVHDSTRAA